MWVWVRRPVLLVVWLAIGCVAGLVLVRLTGLERGTPLVQLVSFTPYLLPVAGAIAVPLLVCRQWTSGGAAVVLVAVLGILVLPRALDDSEQAAGVPLRVMSANLLVGGAHEALIELVRRERPDILSVQELTAESVAALDAAGIAELLPYRVLRPLPSVAGTGLYARVPLSDAGQISDRSAFEMTRATMDHNGIRLDIVAVHTTPPVPTRVARFRADFRRLPSADPNDGTVTILAGDFNATLDHRVMRELLNRGYVDAAEATGDGLLPTWGYGRPVLPVTIDHILFERPTAARSTRVDPLHRSDHRAVTADLLLPSRRNAI